LQRFPARHDPQAAGKVGSIDAGCGPRIDAPAQRLLSRHACVEIDHAQSQGGLCGVQAVATRVKS
jgi:hypothetical protein